MNGVLPPDTNGDVGPNHYVQMVNLSFAIYDKSGTKLYGPAAGNTLFSGFGGPCQNTNDGDPIVLYDHLSDRWLLSQFALPNYPDGPFYECIAISTGPDPTGSYYRYQFQVPVNKMNDYPKLGVWPDGYYMSVNQFNGGTGTWAGAGAFSFERSRMLIGASAQMVYFDLHDANANFGGQLPSDLDGPAPPAGTPNYFAEFDDSSWIGPSDALRIWEFHVDWNNPATSTFGLLEQPNQVIPTAPFTPLICGSGPNLTLDCIPQPSTNKKLDSLSDRLMHRLQYRNFGTHQVLMANHTVDVGLDRAGIRWYELRKPSTWSIFQQGTQGPADATHRWMGSVAMDGAGNIALGYSVSSGSLFPSINYAGRLSSDPTGSLGAEQVLHTGVGSQTLAGRWGDYSMTAVDPSDDCTFWHTNEYYSATSSANWKTRVGAFQSSSCSADLSITKTDSPDPVTAGSNLTYTIAVDNLGSDNAGGVTVSDTLPAGTTFVSASGGGTYNAGTNTVTWSLGLITPAQAPVSRTLTVNVSSATTGTLNNTASVSSSTPDPNAANNSESESTAVETSAELSITKSDSPDPVSAGSNLTYTINVDNLGPSNASGVTVSDTLPPGVSFVSASGGGTYDSGTNTVTWNLGTITPAEAPVSRTLTVTVNPSATGSLSNTASVSSSTTDPAPGNNSDTEATNVGAAATSADLSITKTDSPDPVDAGNNLTYTITVDNLGAGDASGVTVTDMLPPGTTFVSATSGGTHNAGTVTWNLGTVTAAQAPVVLTLTVTVGPSTTGPISNTASVSSSTSDPSSSNNSDSESTAVNVWADLSLTKTDSPDPVTAGNNLTYTITVDNLGPSTGTGVTVSDPLPSGVTFVSASGGGTHDAGTNTVSWNLGTITPAQAPISVTVTVALPPSVTGLLSNTATVSSPTPDPALANNSEGESTTVATSADLSITKADSPDPVTPGNNLTYSITVDNLGPSNASGVSVSDPLPAGVTFVSASGGGTLSSGTVTWNLGTITPAQVPVVLTLTVAVDPSTSTTINNTASVSSSTSDPNDTNNSDSESTAVSGPADLSISKTDSADPVTAGNNLTYTITVDNLGPSDAAGVSVSDTLPAGVTFVSASGGGALSAGTVTWNLGTVTAAQAPVALTLTVNVGSGTSGPLSNTATVSSSTPDPGAANNSDTEGTAVGFSADLSMTKTDSSDPVSAGKNLIYSLTVDNLGPSNASGVTVTDALPAGVTFVSATGGGIHDPGTNAVTWNLGTVTPAQAPVVITITVAVGASTTGPLSNTASVASSTSDPSSANNSDTETTTVGVGQVLPEGATHSGFKSFVLLANPSTTTPATVDLTYLTPGGVFSPASVQDLTVAPQRRATININETLPVAADVATLVLSEQTIVAEVSVHKAGSLASMEMAAAAPSSEWIVPEGATHSGFSTFITIANPDLATSTHVDVDYLPKTGPIIDGPDALVIPAGGRTTLSVNGRLGSGGCGCVDDISTRISVNGTEPDVVVGLSLHRTTGSDLGIGGSLGVTSTQPTWVIAEGATHSGFATFVLVANPNPADASVNVTYLTKNQGTHARPLALNVPANSRRTLDINTELAALGLSPDDVSTLVNATAGTVAVESTVQKNDASGFVIADSVGSGGGDVAAASGSQWLAAEGATHSGFSTFVLVANPGSTPARIDVKFLTPTGSLSPVSLQDVVIPAGSRFTISVNLFVALSDVSTLIQTDSGKVVVEMTVDRVFSGFSKGRSLGFRLS